MYQKIQEENIEGIRELYNKFPEFPKPARHQLPGNGLDGYIAVKDDKIIGAVYVLIAANGPYVHMQWFVGDRDYISPTKKEELQGLLTYACDEMANAGFLYAMGMANIREQKGLLEIYNDAGFESYTPLTYEMCKILKK